MAELIFPVFAFLHFHNFTSSWVIVQQGWGKWKEWGKKNTEKESAEEVLVCALVISLHSKLYSNFAFIFFTKGSLQFQKKMAQH